MNSKSNSSFNITSTGLDILLNLEKVNNSKFEGIFKLMTKYYMNYLQIIQNIYKEKEDIKKEITIEYIFYITLLYDEILKNIYINNRISIYVLARTLVESSVKFIFIQRNNSEISELFKDCENIIIGKYKISDFNKKYNKNINYIHDNFSLDICLEKINFKTYRKGISAIIEFIISKEPDYKLLLKNYKKYCKNIHVNLASIKCNVYNYQSGKKGNYDYLLDIILLLNYTLYNVVYELYYGQYKKLISLEEYKNFDKMYHNIGNKLLELYKLK